MQEGWQAYQAGQYDRAFDIFSEQFKKKPDSIDANFALGMAAVKKGKLSHAAFAFERILMVEPDHQRARLELARTYADMGLYEQAQAEFQKVLEAHPPVRVQENVEVYMRTLQRMQKKWALSGQIGVGGFYDDNVNYGPSDFLIDTAIGPLQVATSSLPVSAAGAAFSGNVRGIYDFGRKQSWMGIAELSGYQNFLDGASDQDVGFYRAKAGLARAGTQTYLDLPVKCDYLEFGHDSLLTIYGVEPLFLYAPSASWQHISRGMAEHRIYREGGDRDGPYLRFNQTLKYLFGRERHSLSLTLGGFYEDVESPAYDNSGWEVALNGEYKIAFGLTAYAIAQYLEPHYREKLLPDFQDEPRTDRQFQGVIGAQYVFKARYGMDLNYRYVNNNSNFGLYEYDRSVTTLSTFINF
ncbi:MAG: hypothetical protein A2X46_18010 [Lentisphaerae bacterium GWF2_57_35]|nr:MAG: hypothetical protein A2X46_18010 [Lentisphaerae bacterium GWF2_57_35]